MTTITVTQYGPGGFDPTKPDGNVVAVEPVEIPPEVAAEATLRQQAQASLTALRTSIDTLKAITDKTNANIGPADTKAVARETRRVARQVLAVSRLLLGALDSADTGTE